MTTQQRTRYLNRLGAAMLIDGAFCTIERDGSEFLCVTIEREYTQESTAWFGPDFALHDDTLELWDWLDPGIACGGIVKAWTPPPEPSVVIAYIKRTRKKWRRTF